MSSPTLSNGILYMASTDFNVYAIDAVTGLKKWSFQTLNYSIPEAHYYQSSPVVVNGTVYIGGDKIYAIDAATGSLKWSYKTTREITNSPCYYNGYVYISDMAGITYIFDAVSGDLIWRSSVYYDRGVYFYIASPHIHRGYLYNMAAVGWTQPELYISAPDWNHELLPHMGWGDEKLGYCSGPVFCGDTLYLAFNNSLYAYRDSTPFDMQLRWKASFDIPIDMAIPVADTGHVYVPSSTGEMYALRTSDGSRDWTFRTGDGMIRSSPTLANGVLYFSGKYYFYAIYAATGKEIWRIPVTGTYYSQSSAVVLTKSGKVIHSNATASSD
jgi:outer membrane protein assembly factor BamB